MTGNHQRINKTAAILLFLSEPALYEQIYGSAALLRISKEITQVFTDSKEKETINQFISGKIADEAEKVRIIQLIESKTINSTDKT